MDRIPWEISELGLASYLDKVGFRTGGRPLLSASICYDDEMFLSLSIPSPLSISICNAE